MFKSRGGQGARKEGVFGGEAHKEPSHTPVKDTPKPGHATSSMEKDQGKKKSGSLSPGCREGKVVTY